MNKGRVASRIRIQFLGLLMLLGMGALGLRLWWIQVAHGSEWTSQLRGSSQATVRIPSVRGEIKDRNGVTLVQNRASYEVDFYLPEMVKGYRERFGSPPLPSIERSSTACRKTRRNRTSLKLLMMASYRVLTSLIWRATTTPASWSGTIATIPRSRFRISKTSIFPRWQNFRSTMLDYPECISPLSRCALMFTAR